MLLGSITFIEKRMNRQLTILLTFIFFVSCSINPGLNEKRYNFNFYKEQKKNLDFWKLSQTNEEELKIRLDESNRFWGFKTSDNSYHKTKLVNYYHENFSDRKIFNYGYKIKEHSVLILDSIKSNQVDTLLYCESKIDFLKVFSEDKRDSTYLIGNIDVSIKQKGKKVEIFPKYIYDTTYNEDENCTQTNLLIGYMVFENLKIKNHFTKSPESVFEKNYCYNNNSLKIEKSIDSARHYSNEKEGKGDAESYLQEKMKTYFNSKGNVRVIVNDSEFDKI